MAGICDIFAQNQLPYHDQVQYIRYESEMCLQCKNKIARVSYELMLTKTVLVVKIIPYSLEHFPCKKFKVYKLDFESKRTFFAQNQSFQTMKTECFAKSHFQLCFTVLWFCTFAKKCSRTTYQYILVREIIFEVIENIS